MVLLKHKVTKNRHLSDTFSEAAVQEGPLLYLKTLL